MTQPERTPKALGALAVFDPAAVRISYTSPAQTITAEAAPAAQATPGTTELAGLAGLVWALRTAADLPGVAVIVDPALGDNAAAGDGGGCGAAPVLEIGADLLTGPASLALYGTLAHEIAHLALHHPGQRATAAWKVLSSVAAGFAAGSLLTGLPAWVSAGLAAVAGAAHLIWAQARRLGEYDADTYAVTLLERAGLPGRETVTAMLRQLTDDEPRWYAAAGWIVGEHPTAAARLRNLDPAPSAPRLTWRRLIPRRRPQPLR